MEKGDIVVGSKDCSIAKIVRILRENECFGLLYHQWQELAYRLDIPQYDIRRFRQQLQFDSISLTELLYNIITLWVSQEGSRATLKHLVPILEDDDFKFNADTLWEEFGLPLKVKEKSKHEGEGDGESQKQKGDGGKTTPAQVEDGSQPSLPPNDDKKKPRPSSISREPSAEEKDKQGPEQKPDDISTSDQIKDQQPDLPDEQKSHPPPVEPIPGGGLEGEQDGDETTRPLLDTTGDKAEEVQPEIPNEDEGQTPRHPPTSTSSTSPSNSQEVSSLFDLLGSIIEVSPFRDNSNKSDKDDSSETNVSASKTPFILNLRRSLFNIVCWITILLSLIDLPWECYKFLNHVKGTNKVFSYIAFLRKLGTTALRLAFLYVGFYKTVEFAKNLRNKHKYPSTRYEAIFTKKHYWISFLSLFITLFVSTTGFWMSREYFQNYSEMDKLTFLSNTANFSTNYYLEISFLATFKFFLMIVEQYALDMILLSAILLNLGMNALVGDVKKYFDDLEKERRQRQMSISKPCGNTGFGLVKSSVRRLRSKKSKEEIPLQTKKTNDVAIPIDSNLPEATKPDTNKLLGLQAQYKDLRTVFKSTNKLIGLIYSIFLFIGLLLISSLEDTILDGKIHITDKVEYGFGFLKMCGIVYLGCAISYSFQKLKEDEYAGFFIEVDIPRRKDNSPNEKDQKSKDFKQKSMFLDESDPFSSSKTGQQTPIGLGNEPFTMNVKFLAHNLGLALFTIFLGIISTRGDNGNTVPIKMNNSFVANGTYYQCNKCIAQKPVGL